MTEWQIPRGANAIRCNQVRRLRRDRANRGLSTTGAEFVRFAAHKLDCRSEYIVACLQQIRHEDHTPTTSNF